MPAAVAVCPIELFAGSPPNIRANGVAKPCRSAAGKLLILCAKKFSAPAFACPYPTGRLNCFGVTQHGEYFGIAPDRKIDSHRSVRYLSYRG